MKSLILSMIVKNEEQMLAEALESAKGVDDIFILDTGSTDKTIEIAKKYTKNVLTHYKWNDNFAEARNECKKHCKGDWLLILDADEILKTPVMRIKQMINSTWIGKYDILFFDVITALEKNIQPRCLRNIDIIWYEGAAHNLPRYYPEGIEGRFERIPNDKCFKSSFIIESRFSPNHEKDPDRTMRILEKELKKNPNHSRYLYYLVREWLNRKEPIKALYYLNHYTQIAPPSNELADAWFIAATCYADLGNFIKAADCCFNSIKILPSFRAPYEMLEQLAHPDFKIYWSKMKQVADNRGVLFVRDMSQLVRKKETNLKIIK